ncbi:MAG: GSCFA domain-containing protein [Bacteroidetes bacterium]|nr:GSCFA domain-containing protein [Bacteroidota bacterium]
MKDRFRLPIEIRESQYKINISDKIICLGSCFIDCLGKYLQSNKFDILNNPFGNIFNPYSIYNILDKSLIINKDIELEKINNEEDYIKIDSKYYNLNFHSSISGDRIEDLQNIILKKYKNLELKLKKSNVLIITFGTSIVYKYKNTKKIVGNCHKLPKQNFIKYLMEIEEIIKLYNCIIQKIRRINPSIKIILTISPIKHIKDNLAMNMVSKSILRIACHNLSKIENVDYFPSYEILIDDLRDYRFYKEDMIHPNEIAEKYILELFNDTYFDKTTKLFIQEFKQIKNNINHKPNNFNSSLYKKFLIDTLNKIYFLDKKYKIEFDNEINIISNRLKNINFE